MGKPSGFKLNQNQLCHAIARMASLSYNHPMPFRTIIALVCFSLFPLIVHGEDKPRRQKRHPKTVAAKTKSTKPAPTKKISKVQKPIKASQKVALQTKVKPAAIVARQQPPPKTLQVASGTRAAKEPEEDPVEISTGEAPQPREPGFPEHEYRSPKSGLTVKMDPEWRMRVYVDSYKQEEPFGMSPRNQNPAEGMAPSVAFERKF